MALGCLGIRGTRLEILLVAETGWTLDIVRVIAIHTHLGLGLEVWIPARLRKNANMRAIATFQQ
jgi:hypothetical protein